MANWSNEEYDAAMAAYLDLRDALARREPVIKKRVYERLHLRFPGRSAKSFERRFQNISGLLHMMGEPWIPGLAPLMNFSAIELGASFRRLADMRPPPVPVPEAPPAADEIYSVASVSKRVVPAQILSMTAPQWEAILATWARNGRAGEDFVVAKEVERLNAEGFADAKARVVHVAAVRPTSPFDVQSVEGEMEIQIEVKTTSGMSEEAFYMSAAEYDFAQSNPDSWRLYRVHGIQSVPRIDVFRAAQLNRMTRKPAVMRFWP